MDQDKTRKFRVNRLMQKIDMELKEELKNIKIPESASEIMDNANVYATLSFINSEVGRKCISNTLQEDAFAGIDKSVKLKGNDTTYWIDTVFLEFFLDKENNFVQRFVSVFSKSVFAIGMISARDLQTLMLPEEEQKKYLEEHKNVTAPAIVGMTV